MSGRYAESIITRFVVVPSVRNSRVRDRSLIRRTHLSAVLCASPSLRSTVSTLCSMGAFRKTTRLQDLLADVKPTSESYFLENRFCISVTAMELESLGLGVVLSMELWVVIENQMRY